MYIMYTWICYLFIFYLICGIVSSLRFIFLGLNFPFKFYLKFIRRL